MLDKLLENNRAFVSAGHVRPATPMRTIPIAIVACHDPRLDRLIFPALGLSHGDALVFRSPGAVVRPGGELIRSLGVALFMFDVTDILVIGHKDCRMAAFKNNDFIDSFQRRGVTRDAFGFEDLRMWAGAIGSPRAAVTESVAQIRRQPFLPKNVSVSGLILDEATGAIEVVVGPAEAAAATGHEAPSVAGGRNAEAHAAHPQAEIEIPDLPDEDDGVSVRPLPKQAASTATAVAAAAAGAEGPAKREPLAERAEEFLRLVRGRKQVAEDFERIRQELGKPLNPLIKLNLVESFARKAGGTAAEIKDSFDRMRREIASEGKPIDVARLAKLWYHLSRKP